MNTMDLREAIEAIREEDTVLNANDSRVEAFAERHDIRPEVAAKILNRIHEAADAHTDAERDCLFGRSESEQKKMLGWWCGEYPEESALDLLSRCGIDDPSDELVSEVQSIETAICTDMWVRVADEWFCDNGTIYDYETGEVLRPATKAERDESVAAAELDGGAGVIRVDGRRCYVQD